METQIIRAVWIRAVLLKMLITVQTVLISLFSIAYNIYYLSLNAFTF